MKKLWKEVIVGIQKGTHVNFVTSSLLQFHVITKKFIVTNQLFKNYKEQWVKNVKKNIPLDDEQKYRDEFFNYLRNLGIEKKKILKQILISSLLLADVPEELDLTKKFPITFNVAIVKVTLLRRILLNTK